MASSAHPLASTGAAALPGAADDGQHPALEFHDFADLAESPATAAHLCFACLGTGCVACLPWNSPVSCDSPLFFVADRDPTPTGQSAAEADDLAASEAALALLQARPNDLFHPLPGTTSHEVYQTQKPKPKPRSHKAKPVEGQKRRRPHRRTRPLPLAAKRPAVVTVIPSEPQPEPAAPQPQAGAQPQLTLDMSAVRMDQSDPAILALRWRAAATQLGRFDSVPMLCDNQEVHGPHATSLHSAICVGRTDEATYLWDFRAILQITAYTMALAQK
jgi:hypothetical protein